MRNIELLVPASSLEVLKIAVVFGADAVYIGGEAFGLRAKAKNFSHEDMAEGIAFAHEHGVKVYVTVNILAHNDDLPGVREYLQELKELKPDALIIADPGIFTYAREICPEIECHISTQANNTNYETYRFWYKLGAKRVVTARELSLKEIREIRKKIGTPMKNPLPVNGKKDAPDEEQDKNNKKEKPGLQVYKKALTKAWRRLGYPAELASLRTEIICTDEESELEWLAEQVRSRLIHKEEKGYVYKLMGDIRNKQGQTRSAFENYRSALDYVKPSYVKTELYRIIINDLKDGSRQAADSGKKSDIQAVLNGWLDKYGSLEDIQALASKLV